MIPIVLHIPHASRDIPSTERSLFSLSEPDLERELVLMTDAWTDELFRLSEYHDVRRVVSPVSRLVCDVERFRDDEQEIMSRVGMGVAYTRTAAGEPLREVHSGDRDRIIKTYYNPHHEKLTKAVDDALAEAGACVIIDAHSFPSTPLPYELDQSTERPQICIGFDPVHGKFLSDGQWEDTCKWAGFTSEANRPFSGSIVPEMHLGNENVLSVMIEVRRDLYMDEATGAKIQSFDSVAQKIGVIMVSLATRASEYVETARRMRLPYEVRVPLLWSGDDGQTLQKAITALDDETVEYASKAADLYALSVWNGEHRPADQTTIPANKEELLRFREAKRRELLADSIMERIDQEGSEAERFDWDGSGEHTSPGSSFSACTMEWEGFSACFSDVECDGPFTNLDEAIAGMRAHCGYVGPDA